MRSFLAGLLVGAILTATAAVILFQKNSTVVKDVPNNLPQTNVVLSAPEKILIAKVDLPEKGEITRNSSSEVIPTETEFNQAFDKAEKAALQRVDKLWQRETPRGKETTRRFDEDGNEIVVEQTESGDTVSRKLKNGQVLAIEWKRASGEFLIKKFFESGAEEGISAGKGENARYTFLNDEAGRPIYKEVTNPDGTKYIYRLKDGREEHWFVTKDGRYIRVS